MDRSRRNSKRKKANSNSESDNSGLLSSVLSEANDVLFSEVGSSQVFLPCNLPDSNAVSRSTSTPKGMLVNNLISSKQSSSEISAPPVLVPDNCSQTHPCVPPPWATEMYVKFLKNLKNWNRLIVRLQG